MRGNRDINGPVVFRGGRERVPHKGLRVHRDERKPASLNLYHQRMAWKEVMIYIAHREVHADDFSCLNSLCLAESVTVTERHHITSDKPLITIGADINQLYDNVRIHIL